MYLFYIRWDERVQISFRNGKEGNFQTPFHKKRFYTNLFSHIFAVPMFSKGYLTFTIYATLVKSHFVISYTKFVHKLVLYSYHFMLMFFDSESTFFKYILSFYRISTTFLNFIKSQKRPCQIHPKR